MTRKMISNVKKGKSSSNDADKDKDEDGDDDKASNKGPQTRVTISTPKNEI